MRTTCLDSTTADDTGSSLALEDVVEGPHCSADVVHEC